MALNNLTTLTTTTTFVASVKLTATAADRLGLGFAAQAYPADTLSHDPASEQDRPRQEGEQSAGKMRKQIPATVPSPNGPVPDGRPGSPSTGARAAVSWSTPAESNSNANSNQQALTTDPSRSRCATVSVVRTRTRRDCQSPARICDKQSLLRITALPATTAGK
ncbi:MAG: hypothetical protein K2V38_02930 [Gemmataceae bacterium]|nr:hypothetical protein [Gemmataceae bacterium]